jgi:hypothetical protein
MVHWFNMDKYFARAARYGGALAINAIVDIKKEESGAEPVTKAEAKAHMNVTYTDDDTMIESMIKASRIAIENFTGVSIKAKTITAVLDNYRGEMELPYGPVNGDVEVLEDDEDGDEIEDAVVGVLYKRLTGSNGRVYVTYDTGYATVPEDLRLAILNEVAYRYANRGEANEAIKYETQAMSSGLSESARDLALPYKRIVSIL